MQSKTRTPARVLEQRPSERQMQCLRGPTRSRKVVLQCSANIGLRNTFSLHAVTRMTNCCLFQCGCACQVFSYEITLISVCNIVCFRCDRAVDPLKEVYMCYMMGIQGNSCRLLA